MLNHNDTEIFNLPESGLRQRIINVYGKNLNQKLLSVDAQSSLVTISGFVGRPDSAKKRGALQYFFVNGRFMKHPYFHKAVMQAYEQLIPPGATREALAKSSAIPTIDFDVEDAIDIPVYNPVKEPDGFRAPTVQLDSGYNPFKASSTPSSYSPSSPSPSSSGKSEFDWSQLYQGFESDRDAVRKDLEMMGEVIETDADEKPEPIASVVGGEALFAETTTPCYQYKGRYIVTSLKSGLALIDQYRAHVRILFDQYLNNMRQQKGASQQVLFPEIIEFTAAEAAVLPVLLEDMRFIGFDLSNLGNNSYAINGLPAGLENVDQLVLIKDIVNRAIETGCEVHEEICEAIALSLAKAAAIRPGKTLSADEMDHLIATLFSCPDSNLTPDGKTIISMLTDEELEKRFR